MKHALEKEINMKQRLTREIEKRPSRVANKVSAGEQPAFVDKRGSAATQRKLANMIEQGSPAQRKQMQLFSGEPVQRVEDEEPAQGKHDPLQKQIEEEEKPLQGKADP